MQPNDFRTARILSVIIIVLMIIASVSGLFISGLYRDNLWASSQWRGNDLVTLLVAVPVLIAALIFSVRGSRRAIVVWMGMLDYTLYNYAFYLFGAAFNKLFLIYAAIFTLSIFALIFSLPRLHAAGIGGSFRAGTPVKWISGYMLVWAFFLGGLWIAQSLLFVFTGRIPEVIVKSGIHTSIVFALDLSLLAPFLVVGAFLLWKRRPWGYILGVILNVKGTVYALALVAMGAFLGQTGSPGGWDLVPLWSCFVVACLAVSLLLLVNMRPAEAQKSQGE